MVNIVPFVWSRFEFESDGKKLMTLLLDEGDGDEVLMERLRNEVIVGPIRPASWPRERETAWETKLRQTPATGQGKADQLEMMVYLFVQGVDRSDSEVAWRWVQAMQNALASEPDNHEITFETARVMCALYAARWERNPESAVQYMQQISPDSGITANPWYTVARAATSYAESTPRQVGQQGGQLPAPHGPVGATHQAHRRCRTRILTMPFPLDWPCNSRQSAYRLAGIGQQIAA